MGHHTILNKNSVSLWIVLINGKNNFSQKILIESTGMGRCTVLNKNSVPLWIDLINGKNNYF